MSGPVARYDALIADLIRRARNAADRNKPTMWAYYLDVAEGLMDHFDEVDRDDLSYAHAAVSLSHQAEIACPNLNAPEAARLWARGVYARRIAGAGIPRVSLDWLHKRAANLTDETVAR